MFYSVGEENPDSLSTMHNNGKLKICYDFAMFEMILLHRKTHRVVEFAKSLYKTNFRRGQGE